MNAKCTSAPRARDILDTPTARRVGSLAGADQRTVDKVVLGLPVRGDVRTRILVVLAEIGIEPLAQAPAEEQP